MNDRGDLRNIKTKLDHNRYRADQIPDLPGVGIYALYMSEHSAFSRIEINSSRLLYLGMTEQGLGIRNHFGRKDSSFSSPRRSLGAVLKQELGLVAIPRGSGKSKKDMINYRFAGDGEGRLSSWMAKHLEYSCVLLTDNIRQTERELIQCLQPPLNLTGWRNPQKPAIMKLRKACAAEAQLSTGRPRKSL